MFETIFKKRKERIENKEREQYCLQVKNKAKSYAGRYLRCANGVCLKIIGEIQSGFEQCAIMSCRDQYDMYSFFDFSTYKHQEFENFHKYGIGQSFNTDVAEISEVEYTEECNKANARFECLRPGELLYEKHGFNVAIVKHVYSYGFNNLKCVVCDLFDLKTMTTTNRNIEYEFKYFDTRYTAGKYEYMDYSIPSLDQIIGMLKREYKE